MDNRYYNYGCPAIMHDGRFITNYVRGRVVDQIIKHLNISFMKRLSYQIFICPKQMNMIIAHIFIF